MKKDTHNLERLLEDMRPPMRDGFVSELRQSVLAKENQANTKKYMKLWKHLFWAVPATAATFVFVFAVSYPHHVDRLINGPMTTSSGPLAEDTTNETHEKPKLLQAEVALAQAIEDFEGYLNETEGIAHIRIERSDNGAEPVVWEQWLSGQSFRSDIMIPDEDGLNSNGSSLQYELNEGKIQFCDYQEGGNIYEHPSVEGGMVIGEEIECSTLPKLSGEDGNILDFETVPAWERYRDVLEEVQEKGKLVQESLVEEDGKTYSVFEYYLESADIRGNGNVDMFTFHLDSVTGDLYKVTTSQSQLEGISNTVTITVHETLYEPSPEEFFTREYWEANLPTY